MTEIIEAIRRKVDAKVKARVTTVRFTDREQKAIDRAAKRAGKNRSDFAREWILVGVQTMKGEKV